MEGHILFLTGLLYISLPLGWRPNPSVLKGKQWSSCSSNKLLKQSFQTFTHLNFSHGMDHSLMYIFFMVRRRVHFNSLRWWFWGNKHRAYCVWLLEETSINNGLLGKSLHCFLINIYNLLRNSTIMSFLTQIICSSYIMHPLKSSYCRESFKRSKKKNTSSQSHRRIYP